MYISRPSWESLLDPCVLTLNLSRLLVCLLKRQFHSMTLPTSMVLFSFRMCWVTSLQRLIIPPSLVTHYRHVLWTHSFFFMQSQYSTMSSLPMLKLRSQIQFKFGQNNGIHMGGSFHCALTLPWSKWEDKLMQGDKAPKVVKLCIMGSN